MSQDTPVSAKDNIDRAQVFAVYNVYRLVIGSVLFALTLSASESPLFTNDTSVQLLVSGIFIVQVLLLRPSVQLQSSRQRVPSLAS